MTESQVREQIETREVLQAFERAKFSSMPREVKKDYDDEDHQFDRYSQHTAAEVAKKGEEKGLKRGFKKDLLTAALGMKKLTISTDQIVEATGLSPAEVDEINVDDQES
jgi:predicted transposase YdaD